MRTESNLRQRVRGVSGRGWPGRLRPALLRVCLLGVCLRWVVPAAEWHRPGLPGGEAGGGGYRLRGAVGQPDAGVAEGGGYRLTGGFWNPTALGLSTVVPPRVGELTLTPGSGVPGSSLRARGVVLPAGSVALRAYWEQGGVLELIGRGQAGAEGAFDLTLTVPIDAGAGPARLALLAGAGAAERLAYAAFNVVAPMPGRVTGVVRNAAGQGAGAGVKVRLAGRDGLAVAEVFTDAVGGFSFGDVLPGPYQVQVPDGDHPPKNVDLIPGEDFELQVDPSDVYLEPPPPVMLLSAGAVALPGGSFSGNAPVQVGDWIDTPMARLVSLAGQELPPVKVRFWAEVKRMSLESWLPLFVRLELRKGGQAVVPPVITEVPQTVYPEGKLDFPAFTVDLNSLQLPAGNLTLVVSALTVFLLPIEVGHWEFPVEVVDLGSRWYAGYVKNPVLKVTRRDFYTLRYAFSGALPQLPGVGTPLFESEWDLGLVKVNNTMDLGVQLSEWTENHGAWDGGATAKAALTLLDIEFFNEGRKFFRQGPSLRKATYQMDPLIKPLMQDICFPIAGPTLPQPIDLCGLKFGGSVGISACFGGQVGLSADIHSDLRLTATVAPQFDVVLPIGANLELGPCQATAQISPSVGVVAPIKLDPGHTPAVYWDGLCVEISGQAKAALGCCGLGVDKTIDLFDPIKIGPCPPKAGKLAFLPGPEEPVPGVPPRHASIAYSPAGYAAAVWENYEMTPDGWIRTAPVVSVFDGAAWGPARPIAGAEYAGWEPQIAFLDAQNAAITWVVPNLNEARGGVQLAGARPQGLCDIAGKIVDAGCSVIKTAATVVKVICLGFCGFTRADADLAGADEGIVVLGGGPWWNVRPVIATDPQRRGAVVMWLREQDPIPGRQQTLALYASRLGRGGWTTPERVDPASNFLDLQPSLRFDREGQPAAVWVRDLDGDLDTPADRALVFSRLDGAWTPPTTLAELPTAPWTPSLDFDHANQPVIAFVVPAAHPRTGELLGADGNLSTLHAARRVGQGWSSGPVGHGLRAEQPVLRVTADNHALILTRAFGERFGRAGGVASAVANLADAEPRWAAGPVTTVSPDDRMNWHVIADLHPTDSTPLVLWESRDPADPGGEPERRSLAAAWAVDLALVAPELTFSAAHPVPGEAVEITARVTNAGLKPLRDATFRVDFYDRDPTDGATPFASRMIQGSLGLGEELPVRVSYTPADRAWRTFQVVVDGPGLMGESDETNNRAAAAWGGLAAPADFNVAPVEADGTLRLQWTNPAATGAVRFWLWRTRMSTGETELLGATEGESFTDRSAVPGEAYRYELVAWDAQGTRTADRVVGLGTGPDRGLPDPEWLRLHLVPYRGRLTLTWNARSAAQLEVADELAGDRTLWEPVTEGVSAFGGVAQVTLPAVQGKRFFRLVKP